MSLQVSDFIAIATLATTVFQALSSSRGSKFEFTSLLGTLEALSQAIVQAEALCVRCHALSSDDISTDPSRLERLERLDLIADEIIKERKECEALVTHFNKKFVAYREAFVEPGRGMMRQSLRKLTWIGRRHEAATLEKRLNTHLQALQLRLYAFFS
jgi:hypothetical protein